MRKFAVIDIGSNSVRLMFVADGKTLYKTLNTTQLGEGLAYSPYLKEAAIERTARAVADFCAKAQTERAEEIYVFATAAVRSAQNRADFLNRVRTLCGREVQILSGVEEAQTGIAGALGGNDGAIIDVGGASTEFIVRTDGKIAYEKSVDIGVVRLRDLCGWDKDKLINACKTAVQGFGKTPKSENVYAIGGTATTMAVIKLGLTEYSSEAVNGLHLTKGEIDEMADNLLGLTPEQIAQNPCIPQKRAEVIVGGVLLFSVLMDKLGLQEITVSDSDNLEGFAKLRGLM